MNPLSSLVLDEPPLAVTPDVLVALGRQRVRRRRRLRVAAASGATCAAVATVVPLVSRDVTSAPPVHLADSSTPSTSYNLPAMVRVWSGAGHRLFYLSPHPGFRDSTVTFDIVVDDSSVIYGFGIPSRGAPTCPAGTSGLDACTTEQLPDGSTLRLSSTAQDGHVTHEAVVARPDGTELQIESLDVETPFPDDDEPTPFGAPTATVPAPAGAPAYSLAELRTIATQLNDVLNGRVPTPG